MVKQIEPDVFVINTKDKESTEVENEDNDRKISRKGNTILAISGILFIIGVVFNFPSWLEFIIFAISYILAGGPILLKAGHDLINGEIFDESLLMSVATIGAFLIGQYAEGVAVMVFYRIGEFFQDLAVDKSTRSIKSLMDIRPDEANLYIEGDVRRVSARDVKVDDIIVIKPGERVPLDGIAIDGKSMMDTSALTGEPVPLAIHKGSRVLGGFINKNGIITMKVTKEFGESAVSRILDLVQNASSKKAPTEKFMTKFARYYTPVVVYIAAALAIIPPIIVKGAAFSDWLYRALVFLVISCPCALVISIPLGIFAGIGTASRHGILIKGGNYLEALNNISTVVFDKTGTLTEGVFEVTDIKPEEWITENDLLRYAAYAESYSNHPIAHSIMKAYGNDIDKQQITDYNEISGMGIKACIDNKRIMVGNSQFFQSEDIKCKGENINFQKTDGAGTIVYMAVDGYYAGYIIISDRVKRDSSKAILQLRKLGINNIIMFTGDNEAAAAKAAEELDIDNMYSGLLPHEKVEKLEMVAGQEKENGTLVFVGDGINDSPVLARADVGVAMGALGSDAAIEAADVVLMTDQITKLGDAVLISKKTRKIVWENIIFALGIKIIVLTLGAFGLATMWQAVFADVGVTTIAVLNAMRIMTVKIR